MADSSKGGVDSRRFDRVGRIPTPIPLLVGVINSYVVFPPEGSNDLTLIDTGVKSPESFDALRTALKQFGWTIEQIKRILITHAHMDHFGQAKKLRDMSGATVYASEIEAERMKYNLAPTAQRDDRVKGWFRRWGIPEDLIEAGNPQLAQFALEIQDPIEVDEFLSEGDVLDLGEYQIEVFDTPGHCEGHIVFYERDTQTMFSGDHLLTDISPVPLLSFPKHDHEPRPKSLKLFMESLEKVEAMECARVFPAHGDVIWDHRKLIAGYRLHHERRKLQFARFLKDGSLTPFEVAGKMFPKAYRQTHQLFLVMSEVIGHLDLLLEDGTVETEIKAGVESIRLVDPKASLEVDP